MLRTDLSVTRKRKSYHHGDLRRALVNAAVSLLTKRSAGIFHCAK